MLTGMIFRLPAGLCDESCSHRFSLSPTPLLSVLKGGEIKMTGICFCISWLNKSLLMIAILTVVTKLPEMRPWVIQDKGGVQGDSGVPMQLQAR